MGVYRHYNGEGNLLREIVQASTPGLGDLVEKLAKPIARALRLKCLDERANLRPESKCAQRRAALNRIMS